MKEEADTRGKKKARTYVDRQNLSHNHHLAEIKTKQQRQVKIYLLIFLSQGPMALVTKKRKMTRTL